MRSTSHPKANQIFHTSKRYVDIYKGYYYLYNYCGNEKISLPEMSVYIVSHETMKLENLAAVWTLEKVQLRTGDARHSFNKQFFQQMIAFLYLLEINWGGKYCWRMRWQKSIVLSHAYCYVMSIIADSFFFFFFLASTWFGLDTQIHDTESVLTDNGFTFTCIFFFFFTMET